MNLNDPDQYRCEIERQLSMCDEVERLTDLFTARPASEYDGMDKQTFNRMHDNNRRCARREFCEWVHKTQDMSAGWYDI